MKQSNLKYIDIEQCSLQMKQIAIKIKDVLEEYTKEIDKIEKNEYWTGKAAMQYQQEVKKNSDVFEEASEALISFSKSLDVIISNYKRTDESVISNASNMYEKAK